jgi:translation initiation factor IF-1
MKSMRTSRVRSIPSAMMLAAMLGIGLVSYASADPPADAVKALQGERQVEGTVEDIKADQIRVNTGEVQPRFIPLKEAKEKGLPTIKKGDKLDITVNDQNLIVDYHLAGQSGQSPQGVHHHVVKGRISQPMVIGQERATIRTDAGKEETFEIRSQARSKMAAIPVGIEAVFLLDETNKIADVNFKDKQAVEHAQDAGHIKSPIKGAQRRITGTVIEPLSKDRITVRTADGKEQPFEVRAVIKDRVAQIPKGKVIVLLVDEENKVADIAVPPGGKEPGDRG